MSLRSAGGGYRAGGGRGRRVDVDLVGRVQRAQLGQQARGKLAAPGPRAVPRAEDDVVEAEAVEDREALGDRLRPADELEGAVVGQRPGLRLVVDEHGR